MSLCTLTNVLFFLSSEVSVGVPKYFINSASIGTIPVGCVYVVVAYIRRCLLREVRSTVLPISIWFTLQRLIIVLHGSCSSVSATACVKLDSSSIKFQELNLDYSNGFEQEIFWSNRNLKSFWPSVLQKWGAWYIDSSSCSSNKPYKCPSRTFMDISFSWKMFLTP